MCEHHRRCEGERLRGNVNARSTVLVLMDGHRRAAQGGLIEGEVYMSA